MPHDVHDSDQMIVSFKLLYSKKIEVQNANGSVKHRTKLKTTWRKHIGPTYYMYLNIILLYK